MRTKTHTRALAIAGKSVKAQGRTFTSGLLYGLSAASLFLAGELPAPKAPKDGLASDWKSVGGDLRSALKRHGGK
jgi:hypothetical protein